jgi:hypothetical protein
VTVSVTPNAGTVGTISATASVAAAEGDPAPANNAASATTFVCPGAPVATSNSPIYAGDSLQLSATTVEGGVYSWTGPNGFQSTEQNPTLVAATIAASGTYSVTVAVGGCTSAAGTTEVVVSARPATRFYPVTPCRLFDTRNAAGADAAAPALEPGQVRTFNVGTRCGLDISTVRSLSVNVTVAGPTADGELVVWRGDLASEPITSNISYRAGRTRANNGILELSRSGDGTIQVHNRSTGSVDFILDVNGYFR